MSISNESLGITIKDYIIKDELAARKVRLPKLISIRAPHVIIEAERRIISELENGDIKNKWIS